MGDVLHYMDVPPLVVFSLMAIVLVRVHRDEARNDRLWATALGLIALEGFARMVYLAHTPQWLHLLAHVVALNAYFIASVIFLQSVSARFLHYRRPALYMAGCATPFVVLLTCYGADLRSTALYLAIAGVGFVGSVVLSVALSRPWNRAILHGAMWLPILVSALLHDPRQATYTALAVTFALTGYVFLLGLPSSLSGRLVVVAGFELWALCFACHPWVARSEQAWVPLLNDVWDLQKFVVMFGLLVVSLAEQGRKAEYEALHDALTGLANRRLFEDRLEQALSKANRDGTRVLLFNLDLDNFKLVNDMRGHTAGDELLCTVASRLRTVTRRSDTLARMGGDEFQLIAYGFPAIACESPDEERKLLRRHGLQLAEKLHQAIGAPMKLAGGGETLEPSVSIGFSIYPLDATSPSELSREADKAMYEHKRQRTLESSGAMRSATA